MKDIDNIGEEMLFLEPDGDGEIIFNIDVMLAKRKMRVGDLAKKIGITISNLSILKCGRAKAIRISTLKALCRELDCQPGDLLEYRPPEDADKS